jgi:RES domain-containing protein
VSLAILEVLANSEATPKDYCINVIEVPEEASIQRVEIKDLPANWNASPYPQAMAEITERWVKEGKHLLMRVPSVHSPLDYNILVNPLHDLAGKIRLLEKIPYFFDHRLKGS